MTRRGATPASPPIWRPAGRARRTSPDCSRQPPVSSRDHPGDREVLAFDLYGTLVDPAAVSGELSQVLGDAGGLEAARLWRLKQLEYTFRLTAMGYYEDFRWVTERALGFALASLGVSLPAGQSRRLSGLYDHLPPFPGLVEARLNDKLRGNPRVEVSNCGIAGFGVARSLSLIEHRVLNLEPDLVVFNAKLYTVDPITPFAVPDTAAAPPVMDSA